MLLNQLGKRIYKLTFKREINVCGAGFYLALLKQSDSTLVLRGLRIVMNTSMQLRRTRERVQNQNKRDGQQRHDCCDRVEFLTHF